MTAGNCYCEVTNPQGSCCLGNIGVIVNPSSPQGQIHHDFDTPGSRTVTYLEVGAFFRFLLAAAGVAECPLEKIESGGWNICFTKYTLSYII